MFEPGLIDTHTHLGDKKFRLDLTEVINRAKIANVEHIVNVYDPLDPMLELTDALEKNSAISHSFGVHPHLASHFDETAKEKLLELIKTKKPVAIGEIGLDLFKGGRSPIQAQRQALITQLQMAVEFGLPVVIHCREAYSQLIDILQNQTFSSLRGVIHFFSDSLETAEHFIDAGYFIGIGGPITYPNAERLQAVVRHLPIERLVVETDCPYVAPQQYRGKRNEPAYVRFIVEKIAELKGLTSKDVTRVTRYNAIRLFSLPLTTPPELVYELRDNLYLNITNQCPNSCWFCQRQHNWVVKGHYLKLDKEPAFSEIVRELPADLSGYKEVVFCGLGEPTMRLDMIKRLVPVLRKRRANYIRLDTNGTGNLINGRSIVGELAELFDGISISINAVSREDYNRLCKPAISDRTFESVIEFTQQAVKNFKSVTVTAVDVPGLDKQKLKEFVRATLHVPLRLRSFIPPTL